MVGEIVMKRQMYRAIKQWLSRRIKLCRRRRQNFIRTCCCCCCSCQKRTTIRRVNSSTSDGLDDNIDSIARPVHLGCCGKKIISLIASCSTSGIAWCCCTCCCGYIGGYNAARMLMETRHKRRRFCFCCSHGSGWNERCCCLCNKAKKVCRKAAVATDTESIATEQKPTFLSFLFFSSANEEISVHMPTFSFSMWVNAVIASKYFNEWWNLYELLLVCVFWSWVGAFTTYDQIKTTVGLNIARAISTSTSEPNLVPFVDLDHVSWHATWAHDYMG
jgi:hypothetical protein